MRITEPDRAADVEIARLATIDEVPEPEWDALAAGCALYSSHRWLRYAEAQAGSVPAHLLARRGGMAVAALPVFRMARPTQFYGLPELFPAAAGLWPAGGGILLGGTRLAYTSELPIDPALPDPLRHQVLGALLAEFRALRGDGEQAAMLYLTDESARDLRPHLRPDDALVLLDARARLSVPPDGMAGYRALVSARRWSAVRRERARFAAAGCHTEVLPFADRHADLVPLSVPVLRRYGVDMTAEAEALRFRQQAEIVGRDAWAVVARQGERLVGFTQYYAWHGVWFGRSHGVDDKLGRTAGIYFNTTYYAALDAAAQAGVTCLDLSLASLEAKVGRGARLDPLWALVLDAPPGFRAAVRPAERARLTGYAALDPDVRTSLVRELAEAP